LLQGRTSERLAQRGQAQDGGSRQHPRRGQGTLKHLDCELRQQPGLPRVLPAQAQQQLLELVAPHRSWPAWIATRLPHSRRGAAQLRNSNGLAPAESNVAQGCQRVMVGSTVAADGLL